MLAVTREDQNVRVWVKLVQAMIKVLLELNHKPAAVMVVGDVGEEGSYNVFEILYRYLDHFVERGFDLWHLAKIETCHMAL